MRVTYLVDSSTYGGAEITVVHLLRHLAHGCAVVATQPVPPLLAAAARDRGELVTVARARDQPSCDDLRRAVAATRPDVVHANLVDPASNATLLSAAVGHDDAAAVATCHMIGTFGDDPVRLRQCYTAMHAVVAPSEQIRDLLVDGLGVPRHTVRFVNNGVDPWPVADRAEGDRVVVGGVGRLTAQKGFDLLLAAARTLVGEGLAVEFVLVGEGRERRALEDTARGLPVRFVGFQEDIRACLADMDVFCLPSRADALPLALLEAMMTGLPCVASAVGQTPLELADAVLLVPPEDVPALTTGLRCLVTDAVLRRDLGRRAAARAHADFDVRRSVAAVAAVYAGACTRRTAS